ncbi:MAG: hypothetical protein D6806_18345, partial [Deltaproteobacteria bacterium]
MGVSRTYFAGKFGFSLCLALACAVLSPASVLAQRAPSELPAGKIRLRGRYEKKKLREGRRRVTFYGVQAGGKLKLRAGGPASIVLQCRGKKPQKATLVFELDGKLEAKEELALGTRKSSAFYLRIPPGTHMLVVSTPVGALFRPVRVRRGPMRGEKEVEFKSPELVPPAAAAAAPNKQQPKAREGIPPPLAPPAAPAEKEGTSKAPPATATSGESATKSAGEPDGKSYSEQPPAPAREKEVRVGGAEYRVIEARLIKEEPKAEKPVAAATPSAPDATVEVPARGLGLNFSLSAGGGTVEQDYTETHSNFDVEFAAGYSVVQGLEIGISYLGIFGWQQYRSRNPDPVTLEPQLVNTREHFWHLDASVAFDLLQNKWYSVTRMASIKLSLAPRFLFLSNDVFGSWTGGFRLGLEADGR